MGQRKMKMSGKLDILTTVPGCNIAFAKALQIRDNEQLFRTLASLAIPWLC